MGSSTFFESKLSESGSESQFSGMESLDERRKKRGQPHIGHLIHFVLTKRLTHMSYWSHLTRYKLQTLDRVTCNMISIATNVLQWRIHHQSQRALYLSKINHLL